MSRVLRDDPRGFASTETRERIRAAAEEIGYRANAVARGLRSSRTMSLGLLLPGFTSPVYSAIAHGVEERANEHGYGLVPGTHAAGDPHETISHFWWWLAGQWPMVRQGLVVGVTNPKDAVFFVAVLPQFVDTHAGDVPGQMLVWG